MKLSQFAKLIVACLLASQIAACGGGGGGGGGGSSTNVGNRKSAATGVRVIQGSLDLGPIEVLAGDSVISTERFGQPSVFAGLGTGDQAVTVRIKNGAPIFSTAFTVASKNHFTILIAGDFSSVSVRGTALTDQAGEIPSGQAAIRVLHGMVGALTVGAQSTVSGSIAHGVSFGSGSGYTLVPAGVHGITISREADSRAVATGEYTLDGGKAYSVVVVGELGYFVQASLLND